MMSLSSLSFAAALTAVLWMVPSVGTQGMGTIGQRLAHPDARLLDGADDLTSGDGLARADRAVESALGL